MKKKILSIILAIVSVVSCFALTACSNNTNTVRIVVPDGAPALSVTTVIKDGIKMPQDTKLQIDIVKADTITSEVTGKKCDIAILPSNAAFKIYNDSVKNGDKDPYVMLATATYGNLFVVGKTTLTSISDLTGKIVYSIGQGAVPHKILEKVAGLNSIELNIITDKKDAIQGKINVIFVSDGLEVNTNLKEDATAFGLLGEPAVTGSKKQGNVVSLDMQAEYQKATNSTEKGYPQAVVVARKSFIESNGEIIKTFLQKMVANMDYVNNKDNQKTITDVLKGNKYGNPSATTFPPQSISGCNIIVKSTKTAKQDVVTFLKTLTGAPKIADGFFYEIEY